jgi:hypothetical protein
MPTCFARVMRAAAKAHPPGLHWSSMSIVLLERRDGSAEPGPPAEAREARSDAHERRE